MEIKIEKFDVQLIEPDHAKIKADHDAKKAELSKTFTAQLLVKKPELKKTRDEFDNAIDSGDIEAMKKAFKAINDKRPADKKVDLDKLTTTELRSMLSGEVKRITNALTMYMDLQESIDKEGYFEVNKFEHFKKASGTKQAEAFAKSFISYEAACSALIGIESKNQEYQANKAFVESADDFHKLVITLLISKAPELKASVDEIVTEYRKRVGKKASTTTTSDGTKLSKSDSYKIVAPDGTVYVGESFPESIRLLAKALGYTGDVKTGSLTQKIESPNKWTNWGIGWRQGASLGHKLIKDKLGDEIANKYLFSMVGDDSKLVAYNKV